MNTSTAKSTNVFGDILNLTLDTSKDFDEQVPNKEKKDINSLKFDDKDNR